MRLCTRCQTSPLLPSLSVPPSLTPSFSLSLQLMYKQQFFVEVVPEIVRQFHQGDPGQPSWLCMFYQECYHLGSAPPVKVCTPSSHPPSARRQYLLRALSQMMQGVPKQVLLGELPSVSGNLYTLLTSTYHTCIRTSHTLTSHTHSLTVAPPTARVSTVQ